MIDTSNKFLVGVMGEKIVILKQPIDAMTPDEAINLAAYLVALANFHASHSFEAVLEEVQAT